MFLFCESSDILYRAGAGGGRDKNSADVEIGFVCVPDFICIFVFAWHRNFIICCCGDVPRPGSIYGVIITGLTYLTPIFYPIEILPGWVKTLVEMNPLTSFVEMFRDAVLYGVVPGMELHIKMHRSMRGCTSVRNMELY